MHGGVHTGIRLVGRTSLRIILSDVGERRLGPMRRLDHSSEAIFRKIEKNDDSEGFTYIIPLVPLERAWRPENGLGDLKMASEPDPQEGLRNGLRFGDLGVIFAKKLQNSPVFRLGKNAFFPEKITLGGGETWKNH
jgi:hypothetical protein